MLHLQHVLSRYCTPPALLHLFTLRRAEKPHEPGGFMKLKTMTIIMNITVSLQTAFRLSAAGWKKETALMFYQPIDPETGTDAPEISFWDSKEPTLLPAPTFAEIWDELPGKIEKWDKVGYKSLDSVGNVFYYDSNRPGMTLANGSGYNKSVAEAAAELWIKLVEAGHIKP